ncbi:Homogentisate 1,2-dioxygenase [hydrothermal vent metagenome]|uniref:Homogentisate 1,2-dioxygenase n=1 Tax=hydrothermal vent metagenome TaxID=652676 RepID=A0A3B0VHZ8_9ZZZZ
MKNWIQTFRKEGKVARQAHYDLPENTYEREVGKEGFFGPVAHFYHKNPPTNWSEFEGDLQPRAFDTNDFIEVQNCPFKAVVLMHNASIKVRMLKINASMDHLISNADGDDLLFFHKGRAQLYCDYGHITLVEGDYFTLPRCTKWRLETDCHCEILMMECTNGHYQFPDKGLLGPNAIVDPAVLGVPAIDDKFKAQQNDNEEWTVLIKHKNRISRQVFPFNPLDAVGWRGNLMPVQLNWRDISPLLSHRYHVPPSAHTTFMGNRFLICTFVPRLFETADKALKIPFFHNNDDYDEVLFYHMGNFFSRDNIRPGMVTFHPQGFTHGPHPGAMKKAFKQDNAMTDEVAVMIDTRDPLEISTEFEQVEWTDYVHSWSGTK